VYNGSSYDPLLSLADIRFTSARLGLVPTKYSVYGPLVSDPAAVRPSELPLRRLADDLAAHDVFAVNVSDALRRQAASDLPRNEYVYFIDDTHWSERGIAVAAQALVEAWNAR
jgi:hypothetical protein